MPPRGSAQDQVLRELYRRELNEKLAQTTLFARLIGHGLGVPEKGVDKLLELYQLELSQDRYRPHVVEALRAARQGAERQRLADKRLLEKVEKLTVPDAELPPTPRTKRGRRK